MYIAHNSIKVVFFSFPLTSVGQSGLAKKKGRTNGVTTEYPSTIEFLKGYPLKNEAYLFICKLVAGYSEV